MKCNISPRAEPTLAELALLAQLGPVRLVSDTRLRIGNPMSLRGVLPTPCAAVNRRFWAGIRPILQVAQRAAGIFLGHAVAGVGRIVKIGNAGIERAPRMAGRACSAASPRTINPALPPQPEAIPQTTRSVSPTRP